MPDIPSLADLERAYAYTRAHTQQTPLLEFPDLARRVGAERVYVKAESLQRAGSFKIRGALWRLECLSDEERRRGVVAYSSGNFAQGLAAAGARRGVSVTIVMPVDAPAAKRQRTEALGAQVVLSHHGGRPREEAASELAKDLAVSQGRVLLHPFDDPLIVAGQAGAGLEALEQLAECRAGVDLVCCCAGGGGLVAGVSLAFHYLSPGTEVVAVEPEGFDSLGESLRRRRLTRVAGSGPTVCDALQATQAGRAPFAAASVAGARGVTVADEHVVKAMRVAFDELKLVLEPSGAAALAAVQSGAVDCRDRSLLLYATGGNIAPEAFFDTIGRAA